MKLISRCFAPALAAAALLTPMLSVQAKTVTTPIITLTDNGAKPLDFHLVSQVTNAYGRSYTTIQLDGLGALLNGAISTQPGEGDVYKQLSAAQSLAMLIDPHYAPVTTTLKLNFAYEVWSGSSWAASRLDVNSKLGYQQNGFTATVQGSGTTDLTSFQMFGYAFDPSWYSPSENQQQMEIQYDASMKAGSSPWGDGGVSFKANSVTLTFETQQISAVPEPDALLLTLSGLAVVGVAVKRRQKSRSA